MELPSLATSETSLGSFRSALVCKLSIWRCSISCLNVESITSLAMPSLGFRYVAYHDALIRSCISAASSGFASEMVMLVQ